MKTDIIVLEESKKFINDQRVRWIYENLYSEFKDFTIEIIDDKVIVYGDIMIPGEYDLIQYKIDKVYGNVIVDNYKEPRYGNLKSLENFPTEIYGNFICKMNPNLKSLKGGPEKVTGDFICVNCGLKSLEYMPKEIGKNFYVFKNNIEDISPVLNSKIGGCVDAEFNPCEKSDVYRKLIKEHKVSH